VPGKSDAFLKITMGLALLIAAGSVGYYYSIYLPARDAKLDSDRRLERAHSDLARQAEEERVRSEKEAADLQAAVGRELIKSNYESCLRVARANYDGNWALNCKQTSDRSRKGRADCVASSANNRDMIAGCERTWPQVDESSCSLPRPISSEINSDYDKARDRCLKESTAGLQSTVLRRRSAPQ
jgi:hypothetical protein